MANCSADPFHMFVWSGCASACIRLSLRCQRGTAGEVSDKDVRKRQVGSINEAARALCQLCVKD